MAIPIAIRAFALGTVAGLRSMTAPAATSISAQSVWAGPLAFASAGELLVDKLPAVPPRTTASALAVRVLSGALCGRALARQRERSTLLGIAAGALGAVAGTYGGYYARRYLTTKRGWPAIPVALGEDLIALGLARLAVART